MLSFKTSRALMLALVIGMFAAVAALPADAGGYSGGYRSSSSFSSSRSFSSRSYSSPSYRSYSSPSRSSYTSRSYSSPSRSASTYRSPSRAYAGSTYSKPTTTRSYYSSGSSGRYKPSAPPSYIHSQSSNLGWYALIAYMAYNAGQNQQMALGNPSPVNKDMCNLSMTDMQNIIGEDDVYTKEEMSALTHWRSVCNHPRTTQ